MSIDNLSDTDSAMALSIFYKSLIVEQHVETLVEIS
jgi:hypothetical protein